MPLRARALIVEGSKSRISKNLRQLYALFRTAQTNHRRLGMTIPTKNRLGLPIQVFGANKVIRSEQYVRLISKRHATSLTIHDHHDEFPSNFGCT